jgi:hypothetical protein
MLIRSFRFLKACQLQSRNFHVNIPSLSKMVRIKVLNVAEKNDAAKNIADLLSRGRSQRVRTFVYNFGSEGHGTFCVKSRNLSTWIPE